MQRRSTRQGVAEVGTCRPLTRGLATALLSVTLLGACTEPRQLEEEADGGADGLVVELPPDAVSGEAAVPIARLSGVRVDVLADRGGEVLAHGDFEGSLEAMRLPKYDALEVAPRAVVRVQEEDGSGSLTPGRARISFGADFAIDQFPEGVPLADGDNLIQRGLAGQPSQMKIEIDGGRAGCRIRGDAGQVDVTIDSDLESGVWYRVRCARYPGRVEITLRELGAVDGEVLVASEQGATGNLSWSSSSPLSIGGKLRPDGGLVTGETDQFNGVVSAPVLLIDPS